MKSGTWFRPSHEHDNVLFDYVMKMCSHAVFNMAGDMKHGYISELWPQAEFYPAPNPGFHANSQLSIIHAVHTYLTERVCVRVCVSGTNEFPSEQYVLFNKQSDHSASDTDSHKQLWSKTARLSQSYITPDWHHTDIRQNINLRWLCLQYIYNITSICSSLLASWIRVKHITAKVLVRRGRIR